MRRSKKPAIRSPRRQVRAASGDFEAECPRRCQVDHKFDLGRLYDRQVGGLCTLEDARGVEAKLTISFCQARSVTHQATGLHVLAHSIDPQEWHGAPPV